MTVVRFILTFFRVSSANDMHLGSELLNSKVLVIAVKIHLENCRGWNTLTPMFLRALRNMSEIVIVYHRVQ
jgi:hypothetical protein